MSQIHRIEALNKNFGSKLLISESLSPSQIKGRDNPVALVKVA